MLSAQLGGDFMNSSDNAYREEVRTDDTKRREAGYIHTYTL